MYGSSLRLVTRMPREARIAAREAAAMPFPREETTPPVTNTNFVMGDKFRKLLVYRNRLPRTNRWGRWARHGVGTNRRSRPPIQALEGRLQRESIFRHPGE